MNGATKPCLLPGSLHSWISCCRGKRRSWRRDCSDRSAFALSEPHHPEVVRDLIEGAHQRRRDWNAVASTVSASASGRPSFVIASAMKAFSRSNVTVIPGALAAAERLEGDDGVGVLDAGNHLHLLVDEMADVGLVIDVELDQQVVIA